MFTVRRLELHAAHACNLTCESCSHFSNHGHAGIMTPESAAAQVAPWRDRLAPRIFGVVGGEPTLNPHLTDIIATAVEAFPRACVEVATNGWFIHRHPELPRALAGHGRLVLSQHSDDPEYARVFADAVALATSWHAAGLDVQIRPSSRWWTRRYAGYGAAMRPLGTGAARAAWEVCPARTCLQLHDGALWKCAMVAYMPMQAARWPAIGAAFPETMAYRALAPTATDDELAAFLAREDEPACGHCPAALEHFEPASPLIPARRLLAAAGAGT